MFLCQSGKHWWTRDEDAEKCCNPRYIRVLSFGSGDNTQMIDGQLIGRVWIDVFEDEAWKNSAASFAQFGISSDPGKWQK